MDCSSNCSTVRGEEHFSEHKIETTINAKSTTTFRFVKCEFRIIYINPLLTLIDSNDSSLKSGIALEYAILYLDK